MYKWKSDIILLLLYLLLNRFLIAKDHFNSFYQLTVSIVSAQSPDAVRRWLVTPVVWRSHPTIVCDSFLYVSLLLHLLDENVSNTVFCIIRRGLHIKMTKYLLSPKIDPVTKERDLTKSSYTKLNDSLVCP